MRVKGVRCDGCVSKITSEVGELGGVTLVEVNVGSALVTITWGDGFVGMNEVEERLRALGYPRA